MKRILEFSRPMLVAAAATLAFSPAFAGPPLICWKIETGGSPSLPWNGLVSNTEGAKQDYDTKHLSADTLTLLNNDPSVLAHMETVRRAALYSTIDPKAGEELLTALVARARPAGTAAGKPIDVFDAGYFVESWNQAEGKNRPEFWPKMMKALGLASAHDKQLKGATGYDWVEEAIGKSGGNPEMEYAAALITWWPQRAEHDGHIARAAAGAQPGTPLEKNLLKNFSDRGTTLAALQGLEPTKQ